MKDAPNWYSFLKLGTNVLLPTVRVNLVDAVPADWLQ